MTVEHAPGHPDDSQPGDRFPWQNDPDAEPHGIYQERPAAPTTQEAPPVTPTPGTVTYQPPEDPAFIPTDFAAMLHEDAVAFRNAALNAARRWEWIRHLGQDTPGVADVWRGYEFLGGTLAGVYFGRATVPEPYNFDDVPELIAARRGQ